MISENIISLESMRLKAQVFVELDKCKLCLRPCDTVRYPEVVIECLKNIDDYKLGETFEIDVVELLNSNGERYFYSF